MTRVRIGAAQHVRVAAPHRSESLAGLGGGHPRIRGTRCSARAMGRSRPPPPGRPDRVVLPRGPERLGVVDADTSAPLGRWRPSRAPPRTSARGVPPAIRPQASSRLGGDLDPGRRSAGVASGRPVLGLVVDLVAVGHTKETSPRLGRGGEHVGRRGVAVGIPGVTVQVAAHQPPGPAAARAGGGAPRQSPTGSATRVEDGLNPILATGARPCRGRAGRARAGRHRTQCTAGAQPR